MNSRIECRYSDGQWYYARIAAISPDGAALDIVYVDDGVRERTTTAACRAD